MTRPAQLADPPVWTFNPDRYAAPCAEASVRFARVRELDALPRPITNARVRERDRIVASQRRAFAEALGVEIVRPGREPFLEGPSNVLAGPGRSAREDASDTPLKDHQEPVALRLSTGRLTGEVGWLAEPYGPLSGGERDEDREEDAIRDLQRRLDQSSPGAWVAVSPPEWRGLSCHLPGWTIFVAVLPYLRNPNWRQLHVPR